MLWILGGDGGPAVAAEILNKRRKGNEKCWGEEGRSGRDLFFFFIRMRNENDYCPNSLPIHQ